MTSTQLSIKSLKAIQVKQVLNGDRHVFCEMVGPYRRSLHHKALSITRCKADAEEAVQNAIMNAFRSLHSFRGESSLHTWLMTITINEARQFVRKRLSRKEEPLDCDGAGGDRPHLDFIDVREDPHDALERKQLRRAIFQALIYLPARYNQPFILRYLQLLSIADAATTLGISESCFKTRLRRSRMQMRRALAHWRTIPGSGVVTFSLRR